MVLLAEVESEVWEADCKALGRGGVSRLWARKGVGGAVVRVVVKTTAVGARVTCRLRGRRGRGLAVRVGGRGCRC